MQRGGAGVRRPRVGSAAGQGGILRALINASHVPFLCSRGAPGESRLEPRPRARGGLPRVLADVRRLPVEVDEGARDGRVRLESIL